MTLSTRIAVLNKGDIRQPATPKEICDTPAKLSVAIFVGSRAMNIMAAKVVTQNGAPHAEITGADGATRQLRFSQDDLAGWVGRDVLPGVRPDAITDAEGAGRKSGNIQPFANPATVTEPAGSATFVALTLTISGRDAIARMRADASTAPLRSVRFRHQSLSDDDSIVKQPLAF